MLSTVRAGTANSLRNPILQRFRTLNRAPSTVPRVLWWGFWQKSCSGLQSLCRALFGFLFPRSFSLEVSKVTLKVSQGHTIQTFVSYPALLKGVGIFRKVQYCHDFGPPASQSAVRVLGCQSCSRHSVVRILCRVGDA